jgi:hypothetical protein
VINIIMSNLCNHCLELEKFEPNIHSIPQGGGGADIMPIFSIAIGPFQFSIRIYKRRYDFSSIFAFRYLGPNRLAIDVCRVSLIFEKYYWKGLNNI